MSNRARQRNKDKKAQQERSAARIKANPELKKNNVIQGRKNQSNVTARNKKYTVNPNSGYRAPKSRGGQGNTGGVKAVNERKAAEEQQKSGNITSPGYGKNNTGSTTAHKQSHIKARGGLLRYPLEAMTDSTDYLQIDITKYQTVKDVSQFGGIVGSAGKRQLSKRSRVPGGLTTQSLVNKGTVLLQIPSQIQDGNSASYGEDKLNSLVGAAVGGAADIMNNMGDAIGKGDMQGALNAGGDAVKNALGSSGVDIDKAKSIITKKLAASAVSVFGGNVSVNQLLAREQGQILNPNMELLFNGPTLRNFRFSFKMTPRSQGEAEQCKLIIRTFKMNMAPKVTSGEGASLFLNTPNVFELRYKTGYRNHPFLHKFKQCFLTDISVNYTGEGVYATYENREPISMIMDLTFKELEPIYDTDYFDERGYDLDDTVGY